MVTLPTLYKKTSTGAIQMWSIGVDANTIIVHHGQQDGKIQRTEDTIKNGKNAGRSNATTPAEQALAEATAKWEGKIKKGYVEDVARAAAGEKDIEGGFDCMLAHKFADHGHKVQYPAFIQPKLNGHRCLGVIKGGVAKLYSRTRKPITSCPHIIEELQLLYPTGSHQVDGELYNHAYKDDFETLASLIRQETPAANCTEVQYHLYDLSKNLTFEERIQELTWSMKTYDNDVSNDILKYLKVTETHPIEDEDSMMSVFEHYLKQGYEGAMARNGNSKYVGRRSYDLQKIKEFQDAEFKIVGIKEGRGGYAGCGIFICHSPTAPAGDDTFDVKMRGPKERLAEFFANHSLWQGKELVVKYQYMSKYGIPIFPVGERFKDEV